MIDCITLWLSHAVADLVQPRNGSNVTRPFPAQGFGARKENIVSVVALKRARTLREIA